MSSRGGSRVVVHNRVTDGFVRVPNAFLRDPDLAPGPARVILWLASQSEHRAIYKEVCARELGISRTTLNEYLTLAQSSQYLWLSPSGASNRYVFHVDLCGSRPESARSSVQNLDAKKTMQEDHSLSRSPDGEQSPVDDQSPTPRVDVPTPLPEGWAPNHTHRTTASNRGLDLGDVVDAFVATHAAENEQRADWDRAFGAFLNDPEVWV